MSIRCFFEFHNFADPRFKMKGAYGMCEVWYCSRCAKEKLYKVGKGAY